MTFNMNFNDIEDELKEDRRLKILEEKHRQRLRENNHELLELERKLKAGYINKALSLQRAEREAARRQEHALKKKYNDSLELSRIKFEEHMQLEENAKISKKNKLREELQAQIYEKHVKTKKYEQFLEEKKILDEVARQIIQEQLMETQEKLHMKAQLKADMEEFFRSHEHWKQLQKLETDAENDRIEKILKEQELQQNLLMEEKKLDLEKRDKISQKLGNNLAKREEENRKRSDLMQDLLIQQRFQLEEEKYRKELELKFRKRIETRLELNKMRENRMNQKEEEQKEKDRQYREELAKQLAERDKLDQLSDEKRRRKMLEHRRAIEECLEKNKQKRVQNFTMLLKEREDHVKDEKIKQQLVEEERIKMLKEHAIDLIGFLPPGVLKESDREYLPLP